MAVGERAARDPVPVVSVVVPTRGRPALLRRCLTALVSQKFDPASFEVIVVDDGPDAETCAVARTASAQSRVVVRYVRGEGGKGPAAARNHGWRAARAPFIAFTDDDCLPAPMWLRAGVEALSGGASGACGQVIVPIPERPTDYERDAAGLEGSEFVTASCFYRRSALEALGGFDRRFRIAWREDSDLFFGMLERGLPLVYVPAALVLHPVRPAAWGVSLRHQRRNLFNALLYAKHPDQYRRRIQALPPLRYYAAVAMLLTALAALVLGQAVVAGLALLAWAAWTASFTAQRLSGTSRAPRHVIEMIVTSALIPPLAVFWRLAGAARFKVPFL